MFIWELKVEYRLMKDLKTVLLRLDYTNYGNIHMPIMIWPISSSEGDRVMLQFLRGARGFALHGWLLGLKSVYVESDAHKKYLDHSVQWPQLLTQHTILKIYPLKDFLEIQKVVPFSCDFIRKILKMVSYSDGHAQSTSYLIQNLETK